ncbi:unnamed protein product, partial [Mesorhabditis spiculigera]
MERATVEQFLATLTNSETLLMPGGYHHNCAAKQPSSYFSRLTRWGGGKCETGKWRHGICIWGIEDLPWLRNISSRWLMINKFIPDFDFLSIHCLSESIYNRTHMGPDFVDLERLGKHSMVYYNDVVKKKPGFNAATFTCNITFPQP